MCSDSFQLQGMSERGFLPAIFNKRRCRGGTVQQPLGGGVCPDRGRGAFGWPRAGRCSAPPPFAKACQSDLGSVGSGICACPDLPLPRCSKHGTPTYGILASSLGIMGLAA